MKLYVEGNINRYYVQTLCMIFFPGAKFAEDEEIDENTPEVSVKVTTTEAGIEAVSRMKLGEKLCESTRFVEFSSLWSNERTAKNGHCIHQCAS